LIYVAVTISLLKLQHNLNFLDADDYHPLENKMLMSKGIALNDSQREPWLLNLHEKLKELKLNKTNSILACSALKSKYRRLLNFGLNENDCLNLKFILLEIDYDLVEARLNSRNHEFIKGSSILKTQFEILEISDDIDYRLKLTSEKNVENCVQELLYFLRYH
jgi:gluconokinase